MEAIADTIAADTGLPRPQVELLSVAVTGTSEVAARWWLGTDRRCPRQDAVRLVEGLVWRGISHFPLAAGETADRRSPRAQGRPGDRPRAQLPSGDSRRQEDTPVEVKIGVQHTPREIVLESTLSPARWRRPSGTR